MSSRAIRIDHVRVVASIAEAQKLRFQPSNINTEQSKLDMARV